MQLCRMNESDNVSFTLSRTYLCDSHISEKNDSTVNIDEGFCIRKSNWDGNKE